MTWELAFMLLKDDSQEIYHQLQDICVRVCVNMSRLFLCLLQCLYNRVCDNQITMLDSATINCLCCILPLKIMCKYTTMINLVLYNIWLKLIKTFGIKIIIMYHRIYVLCSQHRYLKINIKWNYITDTDSGKRYVWNVKNV